MGGRSEQVQPIQLTAGFLRKHFEEVAVDGESIVLKHQEEHVSILYAKKQVTCADEALRGQVERVLKQIDSVINPL